MLIIKRNKGIRVWWWVRKTREIFWIWEVAHQASINKILIFQEWLMK